MDLAECGLAGFLCAVEGRDIETPLSEVSVLNLCPEGPACKDGRRASTLATTSKFQPAHFCVHWCRLWFQRLDLANREGYGATRKNFSNPSANTKSLN